MGAAVRVGEAENTLLSVAVTHLADSPIVALVRDSVGRRDILLVVLVTETIVSFFNSFPLLFIGLPTILTITPTWITDRITTINLGKSIRVSATGSFRSALDHGPAVVSINAGNSRPNSNPDTAYTNSGYNSSDTAGKQRIVTEGANEKIGPGADLRTFVPPAIPKPAQTAAKGAQTRPQTHVGVFGNLVLVSWLEDAGKDVIYVKNIETNDVQKITSEPNLDHFRLVGLHPNADPKLFEAVISNRDQE